MRTKLNRALAQIIRNTALEGNSVIEPQENELLSNEEQKGKKKSYDPEEEEPAQKQGSGDSLEIAWDNINCLKTKREWHKLMRIVIKRYHEGAVRQVENISNILRDKF